MRNFKVGDWVYASDWCYGQIMKIEDDVALVEYGTDHGGGSCSFMIEDLKKAEAPTLKEPKFIPEPKYAVVIMFSFDSQVSVLLFNDLGDALNFIKQDVESEYRIDTEENGWNSEYTFDEDEGGAVLTTHFDFGDDVTIWRIGEVFSREDSDHELN